MASATVSAPVLNANQVQDQDRRRKQTIERAKATHLSRQLQLRLQYARLKVDHGWQKQNLNEVENLYFHHSQGRGTQPYPSPSLLVTTQRETSPTVTNGSQSQSTVSFRLGTSPLSRTQTNIDTAAGATTPEQETQSTHEERTSIAMAPPPQSASPTTAPRPPISIADLKSLISMDVDDDVKRSASPMNPPSASTSSSIQRTDTIIVPTRSSPPSTWSSTTQPTVPPSPNYYSRTPASQSSSSNSDGSREFSSGASLTYDTFWSSHSSSTASSSFRGATGHILPPPPPGPPSSANIGNVGTSNGYNLIWESSSFVTSGANAQQSPNRSRPPRSAGRPMSGIVGQEAIAAT